jgi:hypothetical protein
MRNWNILLLVTKINQMKKLLFVLLLMLPLSIKAQTDSLNIKRDYQMQIDNIQDNLYNYHAEKMTSYLFGGMSSLMFVGAAMSMNSDTQMILLSVGAAFSITGTIIRIDSEKWIKRASIRITPSRLTINF